MPELFTRTTLLKWLNQIGVWFKQIALFSALVFLVSVVMALIVNLLDIGFTESQTPWVIAVGAIASSMFIALLQTADRNKYEKRVDEHQKRVEELLERILSKH